MFSNFRLKKSEGMSVGEQVELMRGSVDIRFYQAQLNLRNINVTDPVVHYLDDGWKSLLDPSPSFSTERYLAGNEDVATSGMNPFLHYLVYGKNEGRAVVQSSTLYDTDAGISFLEELTKQHFDPDWYSDNYMKHEESQLSPLTHYLKVGWPRGYEPTQTFKTEEYTARTTEIELNAINPFIHYVAYRCNHVDEQVEVTPSKVGTSELKLVDSSISSISGLLTGVSDKLSQTEKYVNFRSDSFKSQLTDLQVMGKSLIGNIDGLNDGKIFGWVLAASKTVMPILYVDGQPILQCEYPVSRPDVNEALGIDGDTGFVCDIGGIKKGAKISLYALLDNELFHVTDYKSPENRIEENFMVQLDRAKEISQQSGAVAITNWDCSHNPVGRAKVLYDVAKSKRPTIIVSYMFDTFGGSVWEPIKCTDICLLSIPWSKRSIYLDAIHNAGIKFDTVWVCKPRFPSLELARVVSKQSSALILDLDDNEEHFSKSENAKNKAYGRATINYSRHLMSKIEARTSASKTLQEEYGTFLLRHAREKHSANGLKKNTKLNKQNIKIGFIGTVRPHKNLMEAARAIKTFNWSTGSAAQLHVYGDVNPPSLVRELESNGVVVKQNIPMTELNHVLQDMDVVLTGYPSSEKADSPVTKYQISSKIGDALAVGRPVLVPNSESVEDLVGVPGVFLFEKSNFAEVFSQALSLRGKVSLPVEFTISGAYDVFEQAEKKAKESTPAGEVLSILPTLTRVKTDLRKTLVLLWKQNDSGFYGRRVDQIARSYKTRCPDHRVIILELMHGSTHQDFVHLSENYTSEHRLLLERVSNKRKGKEDENGVEFHQIEFKTDNASELKVETFLLEQSLLPENTTFVMFPIIQVYKNIERVIRPYKKIMDVVDNQFAWGGSKHQHERVRQYYGMAGTCDAVVFNSQRNHDFFVELDVFPDDTPCHVIPNWYELPANYSLNDYRRVDDKTHNVIYSGNMNDRIDWDLLARVADSSDDIVLHLVGTASYGLDGLLALLENENVVYHGPLSELDTLDLIQRMDVAVMPHAVDDVSAFMNPLKVHMNKTIGIMTVSTDVPGIVESDLLKIANNRREFVKTLDELLEKNLPRKVAASDDTSITKYIEVVESTRIVQPT